MFKKSLLTLIAVFLAIGGRAELSKDTKGNYLIGSAQELSELPCWFAADRERPMRC